MLALTCYFVNKYTIKVKVYFRLKLIISENVIFKAKFKQLKVELQICNNVSDHTS